MIVGRKVRLRRPPDRGWEHEVIIDWRNDPANKPWFVEEEPITLHSHLAWWDRVRQDPSQRFYLIEVWYGDGTSSELIGTTSLFDIDWRSRTANYGRLLIHENYRGQGYGLEAEFLLLDYAFNHLNLNKIWSEIFAYNEAALKLHEKTGFKIEGVLHQHVYKGGEYVDLVRIGLLAKEFSVYEGALRKELGLP